MVSFSVKAFLLTFVTGHDGRYSATAFFKTVASVLVLYVYIRTQMSALKFDADAALIVAGIFIGSSAVSMASKYFYRRENIPINYPYASTVPGAWNSTVARNASVDGEDEKKED